MNFSGSYLAEPVARILAPIPVVAGTGSTIERQKDSKVCEVVGKTLQTLPLAVCCGLPGLGVYPIVITLLFPLALEGARRWAEAYELPSVSSFIQCVDKVWITAMKVINIALIGFGFLVACDWGDPFFIGFYAASFLLNLYLYLEDFLSRIKITILPEPAALPSLNGQPSVQRAAGLS